MHHSRINDGVFRAKRYHCCSSDEDLYARDFDEDLYARDFDEDLYVRELEDALYARGRQAHGRPKQLGLSHIASHITHIAGAAEAIGNAHAAFKQRRYVALIF